MAAAPRLGYRQVSLNLPPAKTTKKRSDHVDSSPRLSQARKRVNAFITEIARIQRNR